jgi:hypothetical protein
VGPGPGGLGLASNALSWMRRCASSKARDGVVCSVASAVSTKNGTPLRRQLDPVKPIHLLHVEIEHNQIRPCLNEQPRNQVHKVAPPDAHQPGIDLALHRSSSPYADPEAWTVPESRRPAMEVDSRLSPWSAGPQPVLVGTLA